MNDGVIYDITNNSTKAILFGANLSKNIVERNCFSSMIRLWFESNNEFQDGKI